MRDKVLEIGPVFLVLGAWFFTSAAILTSLVGEEEIFAMMLVMDVLLVGFYIASKDKMEGELLEEWQKILLIGIVANAVGTTGFMEVPYSELMRRAALYTWMVLPGLGLLSTFELMKEESEFYLITGISTVVGFLIFAFSPVRSFALELLGLSLVSTGQIMGVGYAALQNLKMEN